MNKEHSKYLKSKQWKAKRQSALNFHGNKCFVCGANSYLHVHHIHYKTHGQESVEHDLIVLCEDHHNEYHRMYGSATREKFYLFLMGATQTPKKSKRIRTLPNVKKEKKPKKDNGLERQSKKLKSLGLKPQTDRKKRTKVKIENAILAAMGKSEAQLCPRCDCEMERRKHKTIPDKEYYFSQWDYCKKCKYLQHYDEYKIRNARY